MRKQREQDREKVEQAKVASEKLLDGQAEAKIEEMTERNFGELEYHWCVDFRVGAGESKEDAEKYCGECREEVKRIVAYDIQEQLERVKEVPSVVKEFVKDKKREVDADLLARCVKVRMDGLRESQEAAEAFCIDVLQDPALAVFMEWQPKREATRLQAAKMRELLIRNIYLMKLREIHKTRMPTSQEYVDCKADAEREYERENPSRPDAGLDQEFTERVYVFQKLFGVSQKYAESHVMREMTLEGKLADMTKHRFNRESVGDLYGKTHEEIKAMDSTEQSSRTTVGDLFGKSRKEILDSGGEH